MYLTKLSFITEEEKKTFHDKYKLKEFMTTKLSLKKILERIIYKDEEN
jgi:hypothetical protein